MENDKSNCLNVHILEVGISSNERVSKIYFSKLHNSFTLYTGHTTLKLDVQVFQNLFS